MSKHWKYWNNLIDNPKAEIQFVKDKRNNNRKTTKRRLREAVKYPELTDEWQERLVRALRIEFADES